MWGAFVDQVVESGRRVRRPRFLFWNTLGGVCWATSIAILAYTIGTQAGNAIQAVDAISVAMLILILVGHLAWRRLRATPTADAAQ